MVVEEAVRALGQGMKYAFTEEFLDKAQHGQTILSEIITQFTRQHPEEGLMVTYNKHRGGYLLQAVPPVIFPNLQAYEGQP
jgi:hypothetical protein